MNYNQNYNQNNQRRYENNGQKWQGTPFNNAPAYAPVYNQPYNQTNKKQDGNKRSWAVYTKMKKGKFEGLTCVNAFRQTRFGLQTVTAFPVDGKVHTGKEKGHDFMRYVVTLSNPALGTTTTFWCLMRLDTKIIVIPELSVCITPNGNGYLKGGKRVSGYFGRNYKPRN